MRSVRSRCAAVVLVLVVLVLGGCGPKMQSIDLSSGGVPLRMSAPEGATVQAHRAGGAVVAAEDFELMVRPGAIDLAAERARASGNENMEVVLDEASALIVSQRSLGRDLYSVYANVNLGGTAYECRTDTLSHFDDRDHADRMLEACRSLGAP